MSAVVVTLSNPIQEESIRSNRHVNVPLNLSTNESIVIYITVAGSVIPMRVFKSDSIASVKVRIQTCKGFVVKRQKLVFGGRELSRNNSLVKDYGVADGNVLHLILKLSDLLVINVSTTCGKEFDFHVDRHQNVGYLKRKIATDGNGYFDFEDKDLFCNGEKLEDLRLIDDIYSNNTSEAVVHLVVQKKSATVRAKPVDRDVELSVVAAKGNKKAEVGGYEHKEPTDDIQTLFRKSTHGDFALLEPIIVNPKVKLPESLLDMVKSARWFGERKRPVRSSQGTGGTYLMLDGSGNKYVAVFKPIDEEPLAVNNPQGLPLSSTGEGLKRGTKVGEGAFREVAAFLLDHPKTGPRSIDNGEVGFSGVPPTVMIQCLNDSFHYPDGFDWSTEHIKIGSLQLFMDNHGNCEDIGPQYFPVEEVHKISVFDIRTANADRHAGNILVSRGEDGCVVLTPIDHGYCLPEKFEDCTFDWLYWQQARQPFSPETIAYIKSLDAEQDIALLKFYGWDLSLECTRVLRISTMLLKKGAERGLSPFVIGSIMCRENLNKESVIEEIVREAQDSKLPGMSETDFLETVSQLMDDRLDNLSE